MGLTLKVEELNQASFKAALETALTLAGQARAVGERIEREVQESGKVAVRGILRWLR